MKKILITVIMCVLLLCQTGWGCQDEPQDFVGGLVDIVLDVVTMPCSLLATCLGLDAGPARLNNVLYLVALRHTVAIGVPAVAPDEINGFTSVPVARPFFSQEQI